MESKACLEVYANWLFYMDNLYKTNKKEWLRVVNESIKKYGE